MAYLTIDDVYALTRKDALAKWLNLEFDQLTHGMAKAHIMVEEKHIAPNGFVHAPVIVGFADFSCACAAGATLSSPDYTFATIELKSNFVGTCGPGLLCCEAKARHLGSTNQVWDAEIYLPDSGKRIAFFRCTQLIMKKR